MFPLRSRPRRDQVVREGSPGFIHSNSDIHETREVSYSSNITLGISFLRLAIRAINYSAIIHQDSHTSFGKGHNEGN
ncbi:hypothetical protein AYI70_g8821 [Smittium culicis]|uniref:Uncharacterized protein n=1 Tax=Smittium culicis TaxID=133412 RepID=A0A1R1XEA3_9FUNG|nr:hypothetical protein AYI70_g8821 [Smittium culicis]